MLWKNNAGTGFVSTNHALGAGLWADYDNDGNLDYYRISARRLSRNYGTEGSVSFATVDFPTLPMDVSRSASWADHNNDGDLDLFLTTVYAYQSSTSIPNHSVLYRNDGDWNFTDVTAEEGSG